MSWNDLRKGRFSQQHGLYFVTCTVNRRLRLLEDPSCAALLVKELHHIERYKLGDWIAWVVIPDHFHGLLSLGNKQLAYVMRHLKGRSARLLNSHLQRTGAFWQPGFYDHALRRTEAVEPIVYYICTNPIRAGLVSCVEEWRYVYPRELGT